MRRFDEVRRGYHRDAADLRQVPTDECGVVGMGVDARADGRRAEIDFADQQRGFLETVFVLSKHDRVGREFLTERHGDRVLQLRPRDLYDIINLYRRSDLRRQPRLIHDVLVEKCRTKGIAWTVKCVWGNELAIGGQGARCP